MKILVLGGTGRIGLAIVYDLLKNSIVETIGVSGSTSASLKKIDRRFNNNRIALHKLDVSDKKALVALMKGYDVGISALPNRRLSYLALEAAIESGLNMVDILEEYHRHPDRFETEGIPLPEGLNVDEYGASLHRKAKEAGILFIDGMGFAPGLSNLTTAMGIRMLDTAQSAIARVGGIPSKAASKNHPLKYMVTWSFEHVLREYNVKVNIKNDGAVEEVDAMTGLENFTFDKYGKNEHLECFITPGMPSFIYTHPELFYFTEKTIRWPGHWQGIQTLKECGLLDVTPVDFQGTSLSPRKFMLHSLEPRMKANPGETDVCVMYNSIEGIKDDHHQLIEFHMWDEEDTKNGITSMARVTGFSAAIAAFMLGEGVFDAKGIRAPEEVFSPLTYNYFMSELEKRNITVRMHKSIIGELMV